MLVDVVVIATEANHLSLKRVTYLVHQHQNEKAQLVVDAVRRDTYFQPSNMVWGFLSEQQPCNICQIIDSLQWCFSQCLFVDHRPF